MLRNESSSACIRSQRIMEPSKITGKKEFVLIIRGQWNLHCKEKTASVTAPAWVKIEDCELRSSQQIDHATLHAPETSEVDERSPQIDQISIIEINTIKTDDFEIRELETQLEQQIAHIDDLPAGSSILSNMSTFVKTSMGTGFVVFILILATTIKLTALRHRSASRDIAKAPTRSTSTWLAKWSKQADTATITTAP